jgi:antitoxin CptB
MSETKIDGSDLLGSDRKKLLFRARHRGFKEADLIIGSYAEAHIHEMNNSELTEFEALLEGNDWDVYAWIIGDKAPPVEFDGPILRALQNHNKTIYKTLIRQLK